MYLCDLLPCVEFSSKKEMRRHIMRFLENLNSSASLDVAGRNVMKDKKFQYFPSAAFQIILVLIEHQVEKSSLL
jgi:myosin-crossreactive antigen